MSDVQRDWLGGGLCQSLTDDHCTVGRDGGWLLERRGRRGRFSDDGRLFEG
jgi:hypothetical protein